MRMSAPPVRPTTRGGNARAAARSSTVGRRAFGRRHHDPRRALAEERRRRRERRRQRRPPPRHPPTRSTPIPPVSNVHSARATATPPSEQSCADSHQPGAHRIHHQLLQRPLAVEVEHRRVAGDRAVQPRQILRCRRARPDCRPERSTAAPADRNARVTRPRRILEQPDHAEHRRGVDRLALGLVVEADVAAGNRHVERAARLADAAHGLAELPHDLGPLGVAEVQVVGRADRLGAGAGDVARRLGHGEHRAPIRVEVAVSAVAVHRHRQALPRALDAHDAGRATRLRDGVGADRVVELLVGPSLAGDRPARRAALRTPAAAPAGRTARRRPAAAPRICHAGRDIGRR